MTRIGMVVFPQLTQLDFTAPYDVLSRMSDSETLVLWKTTEPIVSDSGLKLIPTTRFADCPDLDLIFVPGGQGLNALLDDQEVIGFLRDKGSRAQWVTSVCAGSLLLAAAGLLQGYRAACHWASRDILACFGVTPDPARVVIDRNRITGGGVTAGIDFGFAVLAQLRGEAVAKRLQLVLEYDPQPPFRSGRPEIADPELVASVRTAMGPMLAKRRAAAEQAAARLRNGKGSS
jgi:cyclohexyl-isocyanide hydratase